MPRFPLILPSRSDGIFGSDRALIVRSIWRVRRDYWTASCSLETISLGVTISRSMFFCTVSPDIGSKVKLRFFIVSANSGSAMTWSKAFRKVDQPIERGTGRG